MRIALLANPDNVHVRRWIAFLAGRGHELLVVADPHVSTRADAMPAGVRFEVARWSLPAKILAFRLTPRPHGNSLWKHLAYRPLLREFRPDVVHGFEAWYSGPALARCGPWPRVLTPWGKDVHHDAFQGPIWRWLIRGALRGADRISTNDEELPRYLRETFGIPESKVRAFSWGIDLRVFRPGLREAAADVREDLGIPAEAPLVFSPRRFDPYWGADLLVEAIPRVLARRPETIFAILVADADAAFLARARASLAAPGLVRSIRWIERRATAEGMAALFNAADVFTSLPRTDLLATTVLEGMACGCAPVLADLPAYRKHAPLPVGGGGGRDANEEEAGRNAWMLRERSPDSLAEALLAALGSPAARAAAGEWNAARMRETEDAERMMAKMEDVYAEAIECGRGRAR